MRLLSCAAPLGLVALWLVAASRSAAAVPRGVDPSQAALYSGPTFTCKDGSKTIPIERVNDGYCDCFLDGSDEPGTPACYSGYFWCQNLGFEPQLLSTSFVDDGVCDCCDGSDEALGKCRNTCLDRSASERQAVRDHVAFVRRALDEKQALISSAVQKQRAWQNRKGLISSEVSSQAAEVNKLQAQVKQAEATAEADRKRLAQEVEAQREAARAAEEARQQGGGQAADAEAAKQQQQQQQEQADAAQPPSQETETDEERGQRIASQWIKPPADGEEGAYEGEGLGEDGEGGHLDDDAYPYEDHDDELDDEDYHHHDDDDMAEPPLPEPPSAAEHAALEAQLQAALEKLEALQAEGLNIQRYHQGAANYDFGPNNVFLALAGRCIKDEGKRWIYEACFFDKAVQSEPHAPKNRVSLGSWHGFNSDYTQAYFTDGDPCPGDLPKRSLTVNLVCDDKEHMYGGEEPATCIYRTNLATPIACKEADLIKAEQDLQQLERHEAEIRSQIAAAEAARRDISKTEL
ncbi:glucosidase II beta subunit-like-domain-containing protein [Dunaliella salina]|uniref:Glucosidase 2 subunit beta n=1 Tax=Dunaliella salina TaxID=3046 RepID=A0ABQ7G2M4_DUNSA|nr:glucosidase II beta subunit-like-domain-containing protein [Dunaliella salina]|eukprot:KAF5828843.1 glucosidase II beta subunit-like-domain-containing protein [Dunaliella salina]